MARIVALFFLLFALDYVPNIREDHRVGQMRALLIAAALASFKWTRQILGAPAAALFSYSWGMWVLHNYQPHGVLQLLCVTAAIVVGWWLSRWEGLPGWIVNFAVLQAVFGVAQFFGWNPWGFVEPWALNMPTGFQGQQTLLGALLAAALAPALFKKRYLSAATIFACILVTKSTMSAAAAGSVILLWGWSLSPLLAYCVASFALFAGLIVYCTHPELAFFSATGRIEFWRIALAVHAERPTFGWGPGSWYARKEILYGLWIDHIHNEYLEILVEYGRVGAALAAAALAQFAWRLRLTWHHAMVVALLVNSIGNFPLHLAATGTLFMTGWILSLRNDII